MKNSHQMKNNTKREVSRESVIYYVQLWYRTGLFWGSWATSEMINWQWFVVQAVVGGSMYVFLFYYFCCYSCEYLNVIVDGIGVLITVQHGRTFSKSHGSANRYLKDQIKYIESTRKNIKSIEIYIETLPVSNTLRRNSFVYVLSALKI